MSTQFETDFENDDIIEAEHIKQFAQPINDLESGVAFYREASGDGSPYEVSFRKEDSTDEKGHFLESPLSAGQMVVFKANVDSPVDAGLAILLEDGSTGTSSGNIPLFAGGAEVGEDDIKADQIVVAVYNDTTPARFDVVGVSGAGSGGGAGSLDDLSDVAITSPTTGQMIRHNGTEFVNSTLVIADVDGLPAAIDAKQDELTGISDVPGLTAELAGKADESHTHAAGDITSGQLALEQGGTGADLSATGGAGHVLKQSSSGGAVSVGALAAADMPTGIDAAKIGSGNISNTEFDYLEGVTSSLQTQLDDKQTQSDELDDIATVAPGMAKGDIFVHNGTEITKLNPGSNGQLLSADSTEATGLNWVAASAGAESLDELEDVSITTPQEGQVLRYDDTAEEFVNEDLAIADVGGLQAALAAKQEELTGISDVPGLQTALNAKQDELTELSDVPGLDAALSGKASANHTHDTDDINTGRLAELVSLLESLEPGQTIGKDSEGDLIALTPSEESGEGMLVINDSMDWGDGSDGAVVYDTNTTLTSDVDATTVMVEEGVTVTLGWNSSEGRPALIRGTVSITNLGTLSAAGSNGVAASATNVLPPGGASLSGGGGGGGGGGNSSYTGGAGGTSGRPSSTGQASTNGEGGGGDGGRGGSASDSRGGHGGIGLSGSVPGAGGPTTWRIATFPADVDGLISSMADGGGSGGGGGTSATANVNFIAGSGGGGGGVICLLAPEINSSGVLDVSGGDGGSQFGSGGGGGGGGGGGTILLVCRELSLLDADVSGGAAGSQSANKQAAPGMPGRLVVACEGTPDILALAEAMPTIFVPVAEE